MPMPMPPPATKNPVVIRQGTAEKSVTGAEELHVCNHCGKPGAKSLCGRCYSARYCDGDCQRQGWLVHKTECRRRPKPKDDEKPEKVPQQNVPTVSQTSLCARCSTFDKTKKPTDLKMRFEIIGNEFIEDNYYRDDRGRYVVKERGLNRTRTKCQCRGCSKTWWCEESKDPDGVFDDGVRWSDKVDGFKTTNDTPEYIPLSSDDKNKFDGKRSTAEELAAKEAAGKKTADVATATQEVQAAATNTD